MILHLCFLLPLVYSSEQVGKVLIDKEIFSPGFDKIGERFVGQSFMNKFENYDNETRPLKDLNPLFLMRVHISSLPSILNTGEIKHDDSEDMKIIENYYMPFTWNDHKFSPAFNFGQSMVGCTCRAMNLNISR